MKQFSKQWLLYIGIGLYCLAASGSAQSAIDGARLVGLAMHKDTGRNIYIGALHYNDQIPLPAKLIDADGPRVMEYRIVARRTSIRSLIGSILLQGELATGTPPSANTTSFAENIMDAVKGSLYAGDSLVIRLNKGNSVVATLDGHELTRHDDRAISDYLLMGWVGEGGPSTAFRSSILAPYIDTFLLPIYEAHTVSEERVAAVDDWNNDSKPASEVLVPVTQSAAVIAVATAAAAQVTTMAVADLNQPMLPESVPGDSATTSKKVQELNPDSQSAEPILLASISPSREMIQPALEETTAADVIDAIEYSQRLASFNTLVLKAVYAQIRYPKAAVRRNIQGTLELDLSVDKTGKLLDVSVAVSSGHGMLDKSAIKAATKAFSNAPMEDIDPVAISEYSDNGEQLVIPIPVSFILTE